MRTDKAVPRQQEVTRGGTIPIVSHHKPEVNTRTGHRYMLRRIGSTTYKVRVVFPTEGETMEEKILRMVQNEGLASETNCGMMEPPQMSRQSERSA